jgi:hypothetical protein
VYSTVVMRTEPITPSELYAQLLGFEQHLRFQQGGAPSHHSSTNTSSRGCGMSRGGVAALVAAPVVASPTTGAPTTPTCTLNVRSVSRSGIRWPHVGTVLMKSTFLSNAL